MNETRVVPVGATPCPECSGSGQTTFWDGINDPEFDQCHACNGTSEKATISAAPPADDAQGDGACGEWPQVLIDAKAAEFAPVAWLHQVVCGDGEPDQALSFAPDNFPLQGVVSYRSLSHAPLYLHPTPPQRNDMAQITMGMADSIIAAAAKGQRYPLTANELGQLAHAWKQMYARCPEPSPEAITKAQPQAVPGE